MMTEKLTHAVTRTSACVTEIESAPESMRAAPLRTAEPYTTSSAEHRPPRKGWSSGAL